MAVAARSFSYALWEVVSTFTVLSRSFVKASQKSPPRRRARRCRQPVLVWHIIVFMHCCCVALVVHLVFALFSICPVPDLSPASNNVAADNTAAVRHFAALYCHLLCRRPAYSRGIEYS